MSDISIDFSPLIWTAIAIWIGVTIVASGLLLSEVHRRTVERLPAPGTTYSIVIFSLHTIAALIVCGVLGSIAREVVLFGAVVGAVSGAMVGLGVAKHRKRLLLDRGAS